jgi:hypothetical protein
MKSSTQLLLELERKPAVKDSHDGSYISNDSNDPMQGTFRS